MKVRLLCWLTFATLPISKAGPRLRFRLMIIHRSGRINAKCDSGCNSGSGYRLSAWWISVAVTPELLRGTGQDDNGSVIATVTVTVQ